MPRSQGSGSASTQPAASTSASAAVTAGSSSSAAAATGSTSAAATSSATFAHTSTAAIIPAPPTRLSLASTPSKRASVKHVNFGSSLFANASSSDQRTTTEQGRSSGNGLGGRQTSPCLFRTYGFVNRPSDKDIKEEVVSEDEMGGDDDEPGPSNRASKRTIKSASGVTTRSRSKRPRKS